MTLDLPSSTAGGTVARGRLTVAARRLIVAALQKTRLNQWAHRLYYRHVHGFASASPGLIPALDRCMAEAAARGTLQGGDYLEFGVFKGYAFCHAQKAARRHDAPNLRFFGFDSFAGLPEVSGIDRTSHNEFYHGQYSCSKQQVTANLTAAGVDWSKTFLIEGYFSDSLTEETRRRHRLGAAAVILIDCDLYSSTVEVLNFVAPMLMSGTILIMDDWNCFGADDSRGQRRAFREFLRSHPDLLADKLFSYGVYGDVFVLQCPPWADRRRAAS